ncbi:HNH endonuclease signature motif containing protein [Vibrio cyclitrophicus]
MEAVKEKFLQYGVTETLADKAINNGLTVSKCRTLSQKDMVSKYNMEPNEAKILAKRTKRQPIDSDVLYQLLENSNYTCNICKGSKGVSYVVHHIEEYEITQDNGYHNLIVLCPNDHDLAHSSGLAMGITKEQLVKSKLSWEKSVELANLERASKLININDDAIDYVNIYRIEEFCVNLFSKIPETTITTHLKTRGILNSNNSFDQKYVQNSLSNGRYLFDYINSSETEHYKQLLKKIIGVTDFLNLDEHLNVKSLKSGVLNGKYAYFTGGVCAKGVSTPITKETQSVLMHYTRRKFRIEWVLDPMFLMSMSAINRIGGKNRYIIYCLIRSVMKDDETSQWIIKASPLLIALPSTFVDKTPVIAYEKQYNKYVELGWITPPEDGA